MKFKVRDIIKYKTERDYTLLVTGIEEHNLSRQEDYTYHLKIVSSAYLGLAPGHEFRASLEIERTYLLIGHAEEPNDIMKELCSK